MSETEILFWSFIALSVFGGMFVAANSSLVPDNGYLLAALGFFVSLFMIFISAVLGQWLWMAVFSLAWGASVYMLIKKMPPIDG